MHLLNSQPVEYSRICNIGKMQFILSMDNNENIQMIKLILKYIFHTFFSGIAVLVELYYYYYYFKKSALQGRERVDVSIQSKDPMLTKPIHRIKTQLLKPFNPTPSNTLSTRTFHRDTEWVRYKCQGVLWGSAAKGA